MKIYLKFAKICYLCPSLIMNNVSLIFLIFHFYHVVRYSLANEFIFGRSQYSDTMHHARLINAVFIFVIFVSNVLTRSDEKENRKMSIAEEMTKRLMEEKSLEEREKFKKIQITDPLISNINMTGINSKYMNKKNYKYIFIVIILKFIFIIHRLRRICKHRCKKNQHIQVSTMKYK